MIGWSSRCCRCGSVKAKVTKIKLIDKDVDYALDCRRTHSPQDTRAAKQLDYGLRLRRIASCARSDLNALLQFRRSACVFTQPGPVAATRDCCARIAKPRERQPRQRAQDRPLPPSVRSPRVSACQLQSGPDPHL